MENKSNGMAIAGFVLSLCTIVFSWAPGVNFIIWILGLIFSIVGLSKSKQLGGSGRGLAIAGIVISLIGVALILLLLLGVGLFAAATM